MKSILTGFAMGRFCVFWFAHSPQTVDSKRKSPRLIQSKRQICGCPFGICFFFKSIVCQQLRGEQQTRKSLINPTKSSNENINRGGHCSLALHERVSPMFHETRTRPRPLSNAEAQNAIICDKTPLSLALLPTHTHAHKQTIKYANNENWIWC